ncbi:nucleotide sugar dehydrogenase [bacterium]|nr:nucleotide sugar dehydrogenase [bacterium]
MRVSVFGLGYVGCVSAGCLAHLGHELIGVDVQPLKVDLINEGRSPIVEKDLDGLVRGAVEAGKLRATTDAEEAIAASDVSLVCVGTPGTAVGRLDLDHVTRVAADIGHVLRGKAPGHVVVLRSTVLPGTTEEVLIPALEESSGKQAGTGFRVVNNPEFLREGSAVRDFHEPAMTVVGSRGPEGPELDRALYGDLPGARIHTSIRVAETVKYVSNAFHALKITFANEIGGFCQAHGVEASDVMEIFLQDRKLNVSEAYLRPGFAFGGACLPKDLRALVTSARDRDVELPMLGTILRSNRTLVDNAIRKIEMLQMRRIGIFGISFKPDTDDLRESPMVELVERLLGKGFALRIHDHNVNPSRLFGANKAFVEERLPHIEQLLCDDMLDVARSSDILVIGNRDMRYRELAAVASSEQRIVDLARLFPRTPDGAMEYHAVV